MTEHVYYMCKVLQSTFKTGIIKQRNKDTSKQCQTQTNQEEKEETNIH